MHSRLGSPRRCRRRCGGKLKTACIVQARMGNTRLPGKVMKDLAGAPMLLRVLARLRRATRVDDVIVATTDLARDDAIVELCRASGYPVYRGSESDVLDRYYRAALDHRVDLVVRVTSDCPFIEPAIVDRSVDLYLDSLPDIDYVCNFAPKASFPIGLAVEVFGFALLERLWREDDNPAWREHVTTLVEKFPERYRIGCVSDPVDRSTWRWTVDTPEDLVFAQQAYAHFGHDRFRFDEMVQAVEAHPEWSAINRHVKQTVIA